MKSKNYEQAEKDFSGCNQECIFMWNGTDSSTIKFWNNFSFLLLFGARTFQTAPLISSHLCLLQQCSKVSSHFYFSLGRNYSEQSFCFFISLFSPTSSGGKGFTVLLLFGVNIFQTVHLFSSHLNFDW